MPVIKPIRGIQLNKSHPLARGLVGCWLFNEGSGTKCFDVSGFGNHGTRESATSWVAGKYGHSLRIDNAVSGRVDCGALKQLHQVSKLSIVMWLKFPEGASQPFIFMMFGSVGNVFQAFYDTNDVRTRLDAGGGAAVLHGPDVGDFEYDKFFQFAVTYDGVNLRHYFNAVEVDSGSLSGTTDLTITSSNFFIGGSYTNDKALVGGVIDNCMLVAGRSLSQYEIEYLFQRSFCAFRRTSRIELPHIEVIPVVVRRPRSHVGFRPIEGANRLRGLRRNALY